jgi:hypothetical protein
MSINKIPKSRKQEAFDFIALPNKKAKKTRSYVEN